MGVRHDANTILCDSMGRGANQSLLQYCSVLSSLLDYSLSPTSFYPPSLNRNTQNLVSTFPCLALCPKMLAPGNHHSYLLATWIPVRFDQQDAQAEDQRRGETLGYVFLILTHIWLCLWKSPPSFFDYHAYCVAHSHSFSTYWVPIILFALFNPLLLRVTMAFWSWWSLSISCSLSIPLALFIPL